MIYHGIEHTRYRDIFNVMMDLKVLSNSNPWWTSKNLPVEHGFQRRLRYDDFEQLTLKLPFRRSVVLLGPRRVGKTVMLKQIIGQSIESRRYDANNVLYADMDSAYLENVKLHEVVSMFKKKALPNKPCLAIFDEIQNCDKWDRQLKALTDHEEKIYFVVSGSIASALKRKSVESGFGRFLHFELPPVSFAEYLGLRNILPGKLPKSADDALNAKLEKDDIDELNMAFLAYLDHGGYPEAIFDEKVADNPSVGLEVFDPILFKKYAADYGISSDNRLFILLLHIIKHEGKEFQLEKLSNVTGVSVDTLYKYIEFLEAAFMVRRVEKFNWKLQRMKKQPAFKMILENPSMKRLLPDISNRKQKVSGHRVEAATISQFQRPSSQWAIRSMWPVNYMKFKRNYKEYEVDFAQASLDHGYFRFAEIKWSDNKNYINKAFKELEYIAGLKHLKDKETDLYCTTKSTYHEEQDSKITCLPTAQFCLSLGLSQFESAMTSDSKQTELF